jgi:DNA repair protein RadC
MIENVYYDIESKYSKCSCPGEKYKPTAREQLEERGVESLSDRDLITILLGSGVKGMPVSRLATHVLDCIKTAEVGSISAQLKKIEGMGSGKTSTILASIELGRRFHGSGTIKITKPTDLLSMVQHFALKKQEHFLCASLNGANELIKIRTISVGTLNRAITHPREVFCDAIKDRAAAVILVHNHPSGNINPSDDDIDTTVRMLESSKILGIHLLDHLIITQKEYYSFMEHSLVLG